MMAQHLNTHGKSITLPQELRQFNKVYIYSLTEMSSRTDQHDSTDGPSHPREQEEIQDLEDEDEDSELASLYDFIEVCTPPEPPGDPGGDGNGEDMAGPSTRSTSTRRTALSLDDNEDERVVDEDEEAGKVTHVNAEVRRKWLEHREGGSSGTS